MRLERPGLISLSDLSPYYGGTRCTEWALLHWDCCNIDVTVHELTAEIEGGKIVGQARAELVPENTVHSINVQLTALDLERSRNRIHRSCSRTRPTAAAGAPREIESAQRGHRPDA